MTSWLALYVTRASITVRTSLGGSGTGQIPDLTKGFPAADLAWFMETSEGSLYGPEADRAAAVVRWARALAGALSDLWSSQSVRVSIMAAIPADITLLDIFICSQDP